MTALGQDLRLGVRGFLRNPGLTALTVLVLALGIGANTAIFSVVDALVLRPLPFPAPEQLVAVPNGVMYPDFVDVRAQSRSFSELAAYRWIRRCSPGLAIPTPSPWSRRRPSCSTCWAWRRRWAAVWCPARTSRAARRWR